MTHFLGALKPKVDLRDYKIAAAAAEYPESYSCGDLPPVKNQRHVSSCVAHATAEILEVFNKKETNNFVQLSTNFIYGMQGVACGRKQSGMYLRDACKIVKEYGNPLETTIPGNTEQPTCTDVLTEQLNEEVYKEAKKFKIKSYARCKTDNEIKHALINYGPVLASIKWYNKYQFDDNKLIFDTTSPFGYHAIMIYGYNKEGWLCQNSWGDHWGIGGLFLYPYESKLTEAWSFVDADSTDVIKPTKVNWIKKLYKILNFILNLCRR